MLDSQNPYEKIDDGTPDNQKTGNTGKVIPVSYTHLDVYKRQVSKQLRYSLTRECVPSPVSRDKAPCAVAE